MRLRDATSDFIVNSERIFWCFVIKYHGRVHDWDLEISEGEIAGFVERQCREIVQEAVRECAIVRDWSLGGPATGCCATNCTAVAQSHARKCKRCARRCCRMHYDPDAAAMLDWEERQVMRWVYDMGKDNFMCLECLNEALKPVVRARERANGYAFDDELHAGQSVAREMNFLED